MVQGTTSDAGKSLTVAAICRYLANKNCKVAPFKPQNMALNSAVTEDGGEIGRAQALQAQACRLAPHTDMNPILLKPSSDTNAQVIVHGRALSAMEASAYQDYKKIAMQAVLSSYRRLSERFDCVIVEGAGSPAEINLREGDIANMGFAEEVDCPVILVADIDKGGVFAHIVGTLALLSDSEQARVIGFVINRFRGDISLLEPGIDWLEQKTGKPVLAVIPYLAQLYLDAEDGIDLQQRLADTQLNKLNVAVAVYPRISNHTDFDALRLHPDINLKFIAPGTLPTECDLLILPGSKNVRADLDWLRHNGWSEFIARHLRYGGKVLGICGGYQMLGQEISDPEGIEDVAGVSVGLGYIPMTTALTNTKITELKRGRLNLGSDGHEVDGYEIHCGRSVFKQNHKPLVHFGTEPEGYIADDRQIIGTYLHGLFDHAESMRALLQWAGLRSAIEENTFPGLNTIREQQLDRLSHVFEEHFDWSKFWSLV